MVPGTVLEMVVEVVLEMVLEMALEMALEMVLGIVLRTVLGTVAACNDSLMKVSPRSMLRVKGMHAKTRLGAGFLNRRSPVMEADHYRKSDYLILASL
ncbi:MULTISPECIES: hypothetical protein [unclassified Halomonas]|uniref:hypothetical protein n=1 Tax=unclassified Halomonas TaxID=2609666 RepID=UPI0007DA4753|nr:MULTISPECIES: hypothetical protein [unclassified Halomonas]MBT2786936.1 hypothetical protein [Halomonas sp. ISL-106]MBT2798411.1 hypothetical protein [Halomonas sp. ISL-104]OAL58209.1 hypothetical protein A6R74_10315 [Halomonas sp. ALS9]